MHCRPENWPNLLEAHLAKWRSLPFGYGRHDCAHFVAEWVETLGHPCALAGIPQIESPLAAARYYRREGGWMEIITKQCAAVGLPEIPLSFAGRGDIAVVWIDRRRQALGIANGRRVEVLTTEGVTGIQLHPNAVRVWRT
jgi:hypothetical protein